MPFADTQLTKNQPESFRKIEYLKLEQGQNIIRVLEPQALMKWTHYINRMTVACLGEDCPICEHNKKLIFENKENFRQQSGYYAKTRKYFVNVLDRTPVKICPKCGHEIKLMASPVCPSCNTLVVNVEVTLLNKVRVLSKGATLFDVLNALDMYTFNEKKEPIGITNFDIMFIVSGQGKEQKINAMPTQVMDKVTVPQEALFDLSKCLIVLTPDELISLSKGVQLRDILLARSGNKVDKEAEVVSEDITKTINEIFAN